MSKKGMIQTACLMLSGGGIGFGLSYAGWHLWSGEWTLYETGVFIGYSTLATVGGGGVGYAIGIVLNRVRGRREGNGAG